MKKVIVFLWFCVKIDQFYRPRIIMGAAYNINDITLGEPSHSGHEAYLDARCTLNNERIIYKKNKHGYPSFSRLEVSFSQLAKLFLSPDLTPEQQLVIDTKGDVVGVAVQHLCYIIANKEGINHSFYTLKDPQIGCVMEEYRANDPTKIQVYFLDKLPQGFYARLVEAEKKGQLTIDYGSLASILTTSYTLEEDDLHKGNFGFYLVEKDGKPHAVFFKIDHDLMFVDSIMGFYTRRPFHLFHGPNAFDIHAEDLLSFANLKHSANSYWPTKFGYVANPFDNKEYHSFAETEAFTRLATTPEFIKAKWGSFYKHILIPTELITSTLSDDVDMDNPAERAHIALITQAMVARLAHLRAALFTIKEFRDFVMGLSAKELEQLLEQVLPSHEHFEPLIRESVKQFHVLCTGIDGFVEGDTPLHTAIKLGEYRYEETWRMFGHFINVKNSEGKTALDVALDRVDSPQSIKTDIRKDIRCIMKHLLTKGADKTERFHNAGISAEIEAYIFDNPYLKLITVNGSYAHFKSILRDIGEDHQFCLKYKKNAAIECINHWIQLRQNDSDFHQDLAQLKSDVNGKSEESDCIGLKYIRQLRSKLWIIRQLRGLYGWTTTQMEINNLIDTASASFRSEKTPGYWAFFSSHVTEPTPDRDEEFGYTL